MRERILKTVKQIEGLRDGHYYYEVLTKKAEYIELEFRSSEFRVERDEFWSHGKLHWNIIALPPEPENAREYVLIGAHYDAVMDSPGADDNASGVAVMLEAARALGPRTGLQCVAFSLEEPQVDSMDFLIGSKHFVKRMQTEEKKYKAAFILESVGYVSHAPESQLSPPFIPAPTVGDFIGVVGNRKAGAILEKFNEMAARHTPLLKVVTHRAPMRGFLALETRFSDHAPFWDAGYPAVMITDTAMFRNPYYHTPYDTSDTLSPDFMSQVAEALIHTVSELLEPSGP
ncbi:MAG TPA: M28 family peptidase [Thermodesulfovibrionales bacterium]|nr:M28 family peptidase [Thermodesulfovibrionales bacterium]